MCSLLREYRERAGKSQTDVADVMHVDQGRISKYESGQLRIDIIQLRQYCAAINVPLADFVAELERRLP